MVQTTAEHGAETAVLTALLSDRLDAGGMTPDEAARLVPEALRHELGPMLHWALHRGGVATADPGFRPLSASVTAAAARYALALSVHAAVEAALEQAGLPRIWLKGFALAHTVYPRPELRPMLDLDVLVPPDRREEALRALLAAGFYEDIPPVFAGFRQEVHHYHLRLRRAAQVPVELHYMLGSPAHLALSDAGLDWFWRQTQRCALGAAGFAVLTPEAQLVQVAGHLAFHHGHERLILRRYLDVHLLATGSPSLDWEAAAAAAAAVGWSGELGQALSLARAHFHTPLPPGLLEGLVALPSGAALEPSGHARRRRSGLLNAVAVARGRDPVAGLRYFLGIAFPSPGYMRWRYDVRHRWLLPLYYPYRWLSAARQAAAVLRREAIERRSRRQE